MKLKLKNCPFCGSKVEIINVADDDDAYYMVQCENDDECGAGCCFGEGAKEEIAERWNKRYNSVTVNQFGKNCTHIKNDGHITIEL